VPSFGANVPLHATPFRSQSLPNPSSDIRRRGDEERNGPVGTPRTLVSSVEDDVLSRCARPALTAR
jgi:hypothetical protein